MNLQAHTKKQHPFNTPLCNFTLTFRANFRENTVGALYTPPAICKNSLNTSNTEKKTTHTHKIIIEYEKPPKTFTIFSTFF